MSLLRARRGLLTSNAAMSPPAGPPVRTLLSTFNDFTSSGFTVNGGSVDPNDQTDADGGSTASTFTASGATARNHNVAKILTIPAGAVMIFGVYLKRGSVNRMFIREDQQTGKGNVFDISSGSVAGNLNGGIGSVSTHGGFDLCETKFTAAASTFAGIRIGLLPDDAIDISNEAWVSTDTVILYKCQISTES